MIAAGVACVIVGVACGYLLRGVPLWRMAVAIVLVFGLGYWVRGMFV